MEAGNEYGLSENVTVHGINHCCACVGRLLRSALGDIELRVECIHGEKIMMHNGGHRRGRARPVIAEVAKAVVIGDLSPKSAAYDARMAQMFDGPAVPVAVPDEPERDAA